MGRRKIYHARLMYARPFIDSLDFARNGRQITAEVPFNELPRLRDELENPQGNLSYVVQGGLDKRGNPFLDVRVKGQSRLRCQRCLNGMDYPLQIGTRLLLRDQAGLDALDDNIVGEEQEEFDSILAEPQLDVLNLLEEEILLSLPFAPMHEPGACQATNGGVANGGNMQKEEKNPFAVLEKLKRNF